MTASLIRRFTLCKMQMCQTFKQQSDDTAIWGGCTICGKRAGYVTRKALRAYMDAEDAARGIFYPLNPAAGRE